MDIDGIRDQIDALDQQIVEFIAQRQRLVEQAGTLKTDQSAVRAPQTRASRDGDQAR